MLERMKHEKTVDIYGHVTCMRSQRNYMVQTEDQYIFIHEALLEAATCGNTEVPARNLFAHIQKLTQVPPGESVTSMELEFKVGGRAPARRFSSALSLPKELHGLLIQGFGEMGCGSLQIVILLCVSKAGRQ